jgi:signal transduction histidine kinase
MSICASAVFSELKSRPTHGLRTLLALLLCSLLTVVGSAQADVARQLVAAEFVLDDALSPLATADWQPLSLPDRWRERRPEARGERGWYRLRFQDSATENHPQAVYLPKLVMNAEVWLNGQRIGDGGRFEEPIARNWNRPLLFLIPHGLLRPGENRLDIRLRGHAYTQAALHPLWVGPESVLRRQYERAYFLNITVNQTATLLIGAIGILMLSLWMRRRRDTAYAYFGISALVWALQSTNLYVRNPPLSTAAWEILSNAGFQVFSAFLLISLLRFVSIGGRPLIAALWAAAVIGPLSHLLAPAEHYLTVSAAWHLYTLVCAMLTLGLLFRAALRRGNREASYLIAAMCVVVLLALHDWLIHSQHLWRPSAGCWPFDDVFLLHYSAPMVFLAIGLIMTGRFVRVLNEFEALNDQLEARVAAKQSELQASFTRMRELETEQAVSEERERIYRDLHDDVGAKLLSLVYRAATPLEADLARSALQDLRDVVSRTGAESFELDEVVADWRAECEKRLSEAGIRLDWQRTGEQGDLRLTQPQALNLGRILREAISNVIRHAGAASVSIELGHTGGQLSLSIRDDGRGCAEPGSGRTGRGLRNMEMRAVRLGGGLSRDTPAGGGCVVGVTLPL